MKPTDLPVPEPVLSAKDAAAAVPEPSVAPRSFGSMPPDVVFPELAPGFTPRSNADLRGYFPSQMQLAFLPRALNELKAWDGYEAVLGAGAPNRAMLHERLDRASRWNLLRRKAEDLASYARSNEVDAWKEAFQEVRKLDRVCQLAAAQDSTVFEGRLFLKDFLGTTKRVGQKGAATRKRKRAEKVAKLT